MTCHFTGWFVGEGKMEGCCYCHIFLAVSLCMPWFWLFLRWLYSRLLRSLKAEVAVKPKKGWRFFLSRSGLCCFPEFKGAYVNDLLKEFHGSKVATSLLISLVIHFQFINPGKVLSSYHNLSLPLLVSLPFLSSLPSSSPSSPIHLSACLCLPLSEGLILPCKQEEVRAALCAVWMNSNNLVSFLLHSVAEPRTSGSWERGRKEK